MVKVLTLFTCTLKLMYLPDILPTVLCTSIVYIPTRHPKLFSKLTFGIAKNLNSTPTFLLPFLGPIIYSINPM